ncbi:ABC transporter ATP-binding protein [soil metagenome]
MLELNDLQVRYGGLAALKGVSLTVSKGSFTALVGANGAGKTTLFKSILGTVPLAGGSIAYEGHDLSGDAPHARARKGIALVPEGRHVFKSMSVAENLEVGTYAGSRETAAEERIFRLFPRLKERLGQLAGTLSGGEQQMVAIGRGLASNPRLLLLDEPSMGLSPALGDEIFEAIGSLHRETGMTIFLVEQRVVEALELCDVAHVLQNGELVISGPAAELMESGRIGGAYVGA